MTRSPSGFYLALEGVEGAGKSTVSALVAAHFQEAGRTVVQVREPGGTELGEEIRRLLLHTGDVSPWAEAALFAAARAQLVTEVIAPGLADGALVISDRTFYSSLAYQGHARGLGIEEVRRFNLAVVGGFVPDLVVVLDVEPELGLERQVDADRIGGSGLEFQKMVAEGYARLTAAEPGRVVVVDSGTEPRLVAGSIIDLVEERW